MALYNLQLISRLTGEPISQNEQRHSTKHLWHHLLQGSHNKNNRRTSKSVRQTNKGGGIIDFFSNDGYDRVRTSMATPIMTVEPTVQDFLKSHKNRKLLTRRLGEAV